MLVASPWILRLVLFSWRAAWLKEANMSDNTFNTPIKKNIWNGIFSCQLYICQYICQVERVQVSLVVACAFERAVAAQPKNAQDSCCEFSWFA